jgi:opacity protein-like surface antigen
MKFFLVSFLVAILVALAMAADADQQPIIVSFPEGTPYSEMDELKAAIAKVVSRTQSICGPRCAVYLDVMTDACSSRVA